jgi:hypothetical protein
LCDANQKNILPETRRTSGLFRDGFNQLRVVLSQKILHAGNVHHLNRDASLFLQPEMFELRQDFTDLDDLDVFIADSPELTNFQRL